MILRFIIPGPPVPQGRVRASISKGKIHARSPARSRKWKVKAQACIRAAMLDREWSRPSTRPIRVLVNAYFACPKSNHRVKNPPAATWSTKNTGDADNLAKAVMDACNRLVYEDDCQVVILESRKFVAAQGEKPRVEVLIEELREFKWYSPIERLFNLEITSAKECLGRQVKKP